jgi:hypothetical protein
MKAILNALFGAKSQVVVGVTTFLVGLSVWIYFMLTPPTVGAVFHISMFFGLVACYAIIATGLGYRATERVETAVVNNIENADEVKVDNDE